MSFSLFFIYFQLFSWVLPDQQEVNNELSLCLKLCSLKTKQDENPVNKTLMKGDFNNSSRLKPAEHKDKHPFNHWTQ